MSTDKLMKLKVILKFVQETPTDEEHCIKIIFIGSDQSTPNSDFGGSEIIINMSEELSISTEYPVAQPGFPKREQFRHGFDIVSSPIMSHRLQIDYVKEQYDALHNERNIKVSINVRQTS